MSVNVVLHLNVIPELGCPYLNRADATDSVKCSGLETLTFLEIRVLIDTRNLTSNLKTNH